jgi:DNA primase
MSERLVIPIDDEAGRLVGYAVILGRKRARYRFLSGIAKSQVVFNVHRAVATRQATVIVVEGYFDCLKVYQAGFGSVVALMGRLVRASATIAATAFSADRPDAGCRKQPAGPTLRAGTPS